MGWSVGPIPWHILHEYARSYGLSEEEEEDFIFHIRKMDRAFLEWNESQQKKGQKSGDGKNKLGSQGIRAS